MSIFSRMSDIITANLNALLDRAEDPEALLAQVIREMEAGLARARRWTATAVAAERHLRRERDANQLQTDDWQRRAREALTAGREELARRALARKQEHEAIARGLEEQHAEAVRTGESARTALHALEARLAEARRRQRTLLVRHRAAQVRVAVLRQLGTGHTEFGASQTRFDRLDERLSRCVDQLDAEADLHDPAGLEADFADLERRQAVERELEALKRSAGVGGAS